ncbi:MAG: hypothetical protein KC912_00230 [Proteobacteria bacterium]|nr:hypothetical protein [Pseudomonadota bacterium]
MGKLAFAPSQARTFALVGHRSSGKTSLAEVLLQQAGVTRRVGRVDEGTSLLDFLPAERRRKMSLEAGFAWFAHEGQLLFMIDVPGGAAAAPEREISGAGADLGVLVVGVTDGVEQGVRRVLSSSTHRPLMAVLTKMDRTHAYGWQGVVDSLAAATPARKVLPLQLPFYEQNELRGVVDLLSRSLFRSDADGAVSKQPVPEEMRREVNAAREAIVESVAVGDDALLETYLELFELDDALLEEGLARAVESGRILPVCFASTHGPVGAGPLLDVLARFGPPPIARPVPLMDGDGAPLIASADGAFAAQVLASHIGSDGEPFHILRVWSGTAPSRGAWQWEGGSRAVRRMYSLRGPRRKVADYVGPGAIVATWEPLDVRPGGVVFQGQLARPARPSGLRPAIERRVSPDNPRDAERLHRVLQALMKRDAGAVVRIDSSGSAILGGVNSSHLERLLEQIREDVPVETSLPMVPYREAPLGTATAEFEHLKTVGVDPVEFARVVLEITPRGRPGLAFSVTADDEALPTKWHEAIERGVRTALHSGPRAGYPVDGLNVVCVDGDYDLFASDEPYFEIAGQEAMQAALERGGTELLEPLFEVVVEAPAGRVGDVLTEISQRGGRVIGLESPGEHTRISAEMAYRELRTLAPRLEALTSGESKLEAAQRRMAPVPERAIAQAMQESPHPVRQRRPTQATERAPALSSG